MCVKVKVGTKQTRHHGKVSPRMGSKASWVCKVSAGYIEGGTACAAKGITIGD